MKLCTYNILDGGTGRIDPLAEVLRLANADVIIVQEATDVELFHKLSDRLKMDRFLAENPRNKSAAVGLISRLPITEAVNHSPLDPRLTRAALHATVQWNDKLLTVVGVHLHARETLADEAVRLTELPAVLEIGKNLNRGHFLLGDFNTSHPAQVIDITKLRKSSRERIAGQGDLLPREVITQVLTSGYVDLHAHCRPPADFETSFTTSHPAMRVDFIFGTPDVAVRARNCHVFKPEMAKFASDHFPVVAEIE